MADDRIYDFTILYNRHKLALYRYVLKITKSKMAAEDIVHNTFVKLYDHLGTIDKNKTEQWLFRVARNETMERFRDMKMRREDELESAAETHSADSPEGSLENVEISAVIEKELNAINREQSEVYRLKEHSGMNYRNIASLLEITEDLVRSRLFKARKKIKDAIVKAIQ